MDKTQEVQDMDEKKTRKTVKGAVKEAVKEIASDTEKKKNLGLAGLSAGQALIREFKDFIEEYKIVGLAIAFIMGAAATDLVKSLVNNFAMPIITPFIPGGQWQSAVLKLGPIVIAWGALLASIINFLVIAFVVFLVAKLIMKESKVTKK
jgi:large conductance mechanosensitive channel